MERVSLLLSKLPSAIMVRILTAVMERMVLTSSTVYRKSRLLKGMTDSNHSTFSTWAPALFLIPTRSSPRLPSSHKIILIEPLRITLPPLTLFIHLLIRMLPPPLVLLPFLLHSLLLLLPFLPGRMLFFPELSEVRLFGRGENFGVGNCAGFGEAVYDGVGAGGDEGRFGL